MNKIIPAKGIQKSEHFLSLHHDIKVTPHNTLFKAENVLNENTNFAKYKTLAYLVTFQDCHLIRYIILAKNDDSFITCTPTLLKNVYHFEILKKWTVL